MCNRLPLMPCHQLSHTKPTPGLNKYYCVSYCEGGKEFGEDHLIYCPGHYFPVPLDRSVNSHTNKVEPSSMKELEQASPEFPICPSTSGLEHLELPQKASSDSGIGEKFRNIDAICASLASSSGQNKSNSAQGLFKDNNQPSSPISVDSQNGSKEHPASQGSYLQHSPIHQQCSSSMSPIHQDHDIGLLTDHHGEDNSLSTVTGKESSPNPTSQDSNSPFSVSIRDVRSLNSAEVPLNSPGSSVLFERQDSSGSTEECASACSSTTCIEPGSTGSSTVINSPADSIGLPDSPAVVVEENSKQGNEICPSPVHKSDQEFCKELGIRRCHVPTHFIKIPSHRTHFLKCRSEKYLRILQLSEKEIRRKVLKSDEELFQQHGIRPCCVRIRPITLLTEQFYAPFTIHYTRNYIAHVIRVGYNEQLHRKRVNWTKVYDKYLAGRCVKLRCEYFKKMAQKSVDDYLMTQEVYEARERRARLIFKKETENLVRQSEKEARERRARLIHLKETELQGKNRVYYDKGKYILANSKDVELYSKAVESAKRLKVECGVGR